MNIIKEVMKVFNVYGIKIDYRHLSLISDYMTSEGDIRAMNRIGMNVNNHLLKILIC